LAQSRTKTTPAKTATAKPAMAKAPAVKKAAAKSPAAKAPVAKPPVAKAKPVKEALTKSALIELIAEENGLARSVAKGVLASIETAMTGSIHPRGVGEFTFPGFFKIALQKVPARKAGTLVRNPSTGEMMPGAAKPASVRVKIRALSKLKAAAIS
jgi:nucleoid DNA-binding protein